MNQLFYPGEPKTKSFGKACTSCHFPAGLAGRAASGCLVGLSSLGKLKLLSNFGPSLSAFTHAQTAKHVCCVCYVSPSSYVLKIPWNEVEMKKKPRSGIEPHIPWYTQVSSRSCADQKKNRETSVQWNLSSQCLVLKWKVQKIKKNLWEIWRSIG